MNFENLGKIKMVAPDILAPLTLGARKLALKRSQNIVGQTGLCTKFLRPTVRYYHCRVPGREPSNALVLEPIRHSGRDARRRHANIGVVLDGTGTNLHAFHSMANGMSFCVPKEEGGRRQHLLESLPTTTYLFNRAGRRASKALIIPRGRLETCPRNDLPHVL
ncbi:hypothetical protein CHU98_g10147 [Xylaria longipes]|nr:hypothetical protein CHU98_g10147 [Xylaria longipes]